MFYLANQYLSSVNTKLIKVSRTSMLFINKDQVH